MLEFGVFLVPGASVLRLGTNPASYSAFLLFGGCEKAKTSKKLFVCRAAEQKTEQKWQNRLTEFCVAVLSQDALS
jgi:hypothetical protein